MIYPDPTSRSAELAKRAGRVYPGGTTRGQTYYTPYPIYVDHAEGCQVFDVDGTARTDFLNNYTVQFFGHSHPDIVAAVQHQAARGMCFTMPSELDIELAEMVLGRAASFEHLRFTNTGTEAVMHAIKGARAYTGKAKIAKCEGVYHGAYDYAEVSLDSNPQMWGQDRPQSVGHTHGVPEGVTSDVVVLPFNDVAASEKILEENAGDLAGVLFDVVPSRCGGIPASADYIKMLKAFTQAHDKVLILDEVVTWRLGYGGAQTLYGVEPDMTTLGKVIGGGMPIGAVAGREEVMRVFDSSAGKALCSHSGTFAGNPVTMAAGIAAMKLLTPEAIERLNGLGERARAGLREVFRRADVDGQVTGEGSLVLMHFSSEALGDYRSTWRAHTDRRAEMLEDLFRRLLNRGILFSTWGLGCLSTPMGEAEVDHLAEAVLASLNEMKEDNKKELAS
ncbi:MAG: aspartate aminotransferase family protein [Rhodospirillaceae bacterium]|nr:aspartate aminotransferase family protein [Rhodospirillaceae bacterium]MBT5040483.1 aspartate aminotransferase family protein [Rhodospirillaceae bacterium]MBT5675259.1 aspartate aminotransferase family protein [Rhodospirillaceae bacterium]MBT5778712.1 aspartate aminotransferase family protein [Rhodospirillaceae bacterium]MBT6829227.1 aspartate aminotransferase family protein [Rhodospirillaceae bacterium]